MTSAKSVYKRGSVVYLSCNREWYYYDEAIGPVGSGAMGCVYLGFNCSTHQRVAIKMVHTQYANVPSIRERAKLEGALMFMHPNLIEMLGCCEYGNGNGPIWIVSKFVQGVTIDRFLLTFPHQGVQGAYKVCKIFMPVLSALEYLHSKQILHLDIKPSNIMVENSSNVRLMDLGIASDGEGMDMEQHSMMGTPNYAAPEQLDFSSEIDCRTDMYEAAVTLYELLSGVNPFNTNNVEDTINLHKTKELPKHKLIPNNIYNVLWKGAHPQKEQRYANLTEFRQSLQRAMTTRRQWWQKLFGL